MRIPPDLIFVISISFLAIACMEDYVPRRMAISFRRLLARGPEFIEAERVFIRELPLQELGLTILYMVAASAWCVFANELFDNLLDLPRHSPGLETLKGINFVFATALVLYLVLRRTFRTRRMAQEAQRLSQQRFESVALAATDAIWDLNFETRVLWWSEGMHKLFGYPPDEVSNKPEWWAERLHPDDKDRVLTSIRGVGEKGGRGWSGHYRFRRKDGSYASVVDRGFILADVKGKPARIVGGISDVTEREQAEQALEASRRQLRALSARLQAVREEERAMVAREIHDELGQVLTALKINLDWLERKLGARDNDSTLNPLLDRVVESAEIADAAISSVQKIAAELRPSSLDDLGLAAALEHEAQRFQQRTGISCEVKKPKDPIELPREAATAVFRIFQESLTNVARHAKASEVRAALEMEGETIVLCVEDNGCGIAPEALTNKRSLGLLGMRERAAVLGGEVEVGAALPRGTRVRLRLPRVANDSLFWAQL
jgi:two-component system sensor histidine kinase UhpB